MTTEPFAAEELDALESLLAKATPAELKYTQGAQFLCAYGPSTGYVHIATAPNFERDSPKWNANSLALCELLNATPALLRAARREQKMREAARDVVWFQFTNCNDDARRAVERLRKALKGAP